MEDHETRIRSLERWRNEQTTIDAVSELRRQHMDERFDRIDNDLAGIKGSFTKVLWAVGLLVLTAVGQFVLGGGLNVAQ